MAYDAGRGVTVLFGGDDGSRLNDTWEWDGSTWAERTPATSPSARRDPAMAYDAARGVTVLFGGDDGSPLSDTWEWDGSSWTERLTPTSPPGRREHAMVYDVARGVTVLFGGSGSTLLRALRRRRRRCRPCSSSAELRERNTAGEPEGEAFIKVVSGRAEPTGGQIACATRLARVSAHEAARGPHRLRVALEPED